MQLSQYRGTGVEFLPCYCPGLNIPIYKLLFAGLSIDVLLKYSFPALGLLEVLKENVTDPGQDLALAKVQSGFTESAFRSTLLQAHSVSCVFICVLRGIPLGTVVLK